MTYDGLEGPDKGCKRSLCFEELLVFDDPLCVSVCHLNVIPTRVYIPDLRYLFKDPLRCSKLRIGKDLL